MTDHVILCIGDLILEQPGLICLLRDLQRFHNLLDDLKLIVRVQDIKVLAVADILGVSS